MHYDKCDIRIMMSTRVGSKATQRFDAALLFNNVDRNAIHQNQNPEEVRFLKRDQVNNGSSSLMGIVIHRHATNT